MDDLTKAADPKPEEQGGGAPIAADSRHAFEEWAKKKGTAAWKVSAAKAMRGWPIGQEVTEADYDQAVYDACNSTIR